MFACAINFVSATVHFEAFLIAFNISSLAIHALCDNLSNDLCNGSFSIEASIKLFHNKAILQATAVAVTPICFNVFSVFFHHENQFCNLLACSSIFETHFETLSSSLLA
ncbi:hypothetical protein IJD44_05990 [bacterium]|nr:hypothetical protein [bacterium]